MLRIWGFCLAGALTCITLVGPVPADPVPAVPAGKGQWVNISDPVINQLKADHARLGFPGQTTGLAVDPVTSDVYMVVATQGLWKSTDHGATFIRCGADSIGGRCETGFSLNIDPAGKRIACFMLDGKAGVSLDAGATWQQFKDMGRNWDYAAVDWSAPKPTAILAAKHESGGEVFLSIDCGASWKMIAHNPKLQAMGIFDAQTLLMSTDQGLSRSIDGGKQWEQVSEYRPVGRVMSVVNGVGWWISNDGLITSKDKGKTWEKVGTAVIGSLGPYFDPKEPKHIVVAGASGFYETTDGALSWNLVAPLPDGFDVPRPGWFTNVGWDPVANIFYASRMGRPSFRFER